MENFHLPAQPFFVNLFIFAPLLLWLVLKKGINLSKDSLINSAVFATAFGITEAVVVIYLRSIGGSDLQMETLNALPLKIIAVEQIREACTIVMLLAVSCLAAKTIRGKLAVFLYAFSIWDIVYYAGLRVFIGWPQSLNTPDVLFLIPAVWTSPVWFPLLVSALLILVVLFANRQKAHKTLILTNP